MATESLNPPLQPDDVVGPYAIVEQIGSGGTSVVYKGNDTLINKDVAIKQITLADPDGSLRDRVEQEAALQRKVAAGAPDQVVQLIETIDDPRGLMLVSEYVDGPSLEWILSQVTDPMPTKQALGILAGTAASLRAIHGHGIIHRDLKPSNILLPRKGGLKVADFGLAAVLAEQDTLSLGSVRYMAPELFGDGPVDARADLYSLGVIGYEMLAGRTKFDEAFRMVTRDQRNQSMRWMKWHTNPRSKAPPLTQLVPEIEASLSDLIARLMEKDPAARVADAKQLIDAIRRHFATAIPAKPKEATPPKQDTQAVAAPVATPLKHEPLAEPSSTAPLPNGRGVWPWLVGVAAAAAIVLGIAGGIWYFLDAQARTERQQQAISTLYEIAIEAYDQERYTDAETGFAEVANAETVDPELRVRALAGLHLSRGRLALGEERYNTAVEEFETAAEYDAKRIDATDDLIRSARQTAAFENIVNVIESDIEQGFYSEGLEKVREWRELVQNEDESRTLRELAARLGEMQLSERVSQTLERVDRLTRIGQRGQAIAELRDVLERSPAGGGKLRERLNQLENSTAFDAAMARGAAAETTGKLDDALRAYREAATLRTDDNLKRKLADLESTLLLREGLSLLDQGRPLEAEQALTRSLGLKDTPQARAALGRIESASLQENFIRAGDQAYEAGDYEIAVTQYGNALKVGALPVVEEKLKRAQVLAMLKRALDAMEAGDVREAENQILAATRIMPDDPQVAAVREQFDIRREYLRFRDAGNAAREKSKFGDAKYNYERARRIIETAEIQRLLSETEYDHLVAQARSYLAVGEYVPARALLRTAAEIRVTQEVSDMLDEIQRFLPSEEPEEQTP